jgi:hypothetical protein
MKKRKKKEKKKKKKKKKKNKRKTNLRPFRQRLPLHRSQRPNPVTTMRTEPSSSIFTLDNFSKKKAKKKRKKNKKWKNSFRWLRRAIVGIDWHRRKECPPNE